MDSPDATRIMDVRRTGVARTVPCETWQPLRARTVATVLEGFLGCQGFCRAIQLPGLSHGLVFVGQLSGT